MLNKNKPFSLHLSPEALLPASEADKEYIAKMRPLLHLFQGRREAAAEK